MDTVASIAEPQVRTVLQQHYTVALQTSKQAWNFVAADSRRNNTAKDCNGNTATVQRQAPFYRRYTGQPALASTSS